MYMCIFWESFAMVNLHMAFPKVVNVGYLSRYSLLYPTSTPTPLNSACFIIPHYPFIQSILCLPFLESPSGTHSTYLPSMDVPNIRI